MSGFDSETSALGDVDTAWAGFSSLPSALTSATGLVTRDAARELLVEAAEAAFFFMHMRLASMAGESSHCLFLGDEGREVVGVTVSSYHFAGACGG